jgi:hypothetical protein
MTERAFHIILNIKTGKGFECFGKFFVGNNRQSATTIFQKLSGKTDVDEKTILSLELMETKQGLPLNLQIIGCTLQELAENCKIITKETFKIFNLEDNSL